jgi:hypothetical protein
LESFLGVVVSDGDAHLVAGSAGHAPQLDDLQAASYGGRVDGRPAADEDGRVNGTEN